MKNDNIGLKYAALFWKNLRIEQMKRTPSNIETTVKRNALGQIEQMTHRWLGKSPYILVTGALLDDVGVKDDAETFQIGPYRLLKVERYAERDAWLCVRADKFGALRVLAYRATRWLDWFYRRCIVVLAVFELADYHQCAIPSWRDIRALKRWARCKVVK